MSDELVTLAEKREQKAKLDRERRNSAREESRKKWVPLSALIVANIIFISLDVRAFQAIFYLTNSYLLATMTIAVSGGLALYWFDVLYPHSKRHNNEVQKNITLIFTVLAIGLSGALAFADYLVGTGSNFSQFWATVLWGAIVTLTIAQGVAIAWWWSIDNHIAAEARIQEAHAEASDQADEMAILRTKLSGLRGILVELDSLKKDFSPESVQSVAKIMGISLPDGAIRGPSQQPMRSFASETDTLRDRKENP